MNPSDTSLFDEPFLVVESADLVLLCEWIEQLHLPCGESDYQTAALIGQSFPVEVVTGRIGALVEPFVQRIVDVCSPERTAAIHLLLLILLKQ